MTLLYACVGVLAFPMFVVCVLGFVMVGELAVLTKRLDRIQGINPED